MLVLLANRQSPWTGNRAAQWVGGRSYSLYLWHWPVFVALVYAQLQRQALAVAGGMALTLLLGHLSYRWIENPARWRLGKRGLGKGFVPGMQPVPDKLAKIGANYQCPAFIDWARTKLSTLPGNVPVVLIGRYAQAAMGLALVVMPDAIRHPCTLSSCRTRSGIHGFRGHGLRVGARNDSHGARNVSRGAQ